MGHKSWIVISGCSWAAIGFSLFYKGLQFIVGSALTPSGGFFLIALGLLIGWLKGRFVLAKTAKRVCSRILSLSLPIRVGQVYGPPYLILIGFMILLGMSLRFFSISLEIRGFVDVAIGSALLQGSLFYFKAAQNLRSRA